MGQWTTVAKTAEVSREAGAARWISWTESATRERCAPPDSAFTEGTDQDFFNCLAHNVHLRNEGATPIQCRLSLELTASNYKGRTREDANVVVFSGGHRWVSSRGPTTSLIKSHTASCVAIPAEPPPLVVAAGCQVQVKAHDVEHYYPLGAMRSRQEGTVQVEYSTVAGRHWVMDAQVVQSSGFASLDEAALRYMRVQRATSNCPGQRFRHDVEFKLTQFMLDMYPSKPRVYH